MAKAVFSFTANRDEFMSMSKSFQTMDRTNLWQLNCSDGSDEWGVNSEFDEVDFMEEKSFFKYQNQNPHSYMDSEVLYNQRLDHHLLSPPSETEKAVSEYKKVDRNAMDSEVLYNQRLDHHLLSPPPQETEKAVSEYKKVDRNAMDSEVLYNQRLDHHLLSRPPQTEKVDRNAFSMASLELLKKYGNSMSNGGRIIDDQTIVDSKLSTEEIIRIAGARFIQSYSQVIDIASMLNNPFGLSFSDLSDEDSGNVELVELLLASAEKVGYQQFERASRLLNHCDSLCSDTGNSVQRVVYYFSKALQEKIARETGRILSKDSAKKLSLNSEQANPEAASVRCYQKVPFFQVARFTGIQAILENVAKAKRIHIIDLEIRHGAQWPVFMQALQSRHDSPLELLKISAIGTSSNALIEETGKRLASFAQSMNIPFSFNVIMVPDLLELKKDLFNQDPGEVVAIYSEYTLMRLITAQNRLEHVMKLFRKMNPCVMVVMETEANTNSPSFVNRFVEALFFYSAYFDCFDACIDQNDLDRMVMESVFFHHGIRNIVASEGKERWVRHVKIDVWRSFFTRFGMKEIELSSSSLYQANLMRKQFACVNSCTLHMNEKCLLIGWKGTPIHSLSVWKFI